MTLSPPDTELQADDRIVRSVARAMCGSGRSHPCLYHIAQAKLAVAAIEAAGLMIVPHEGFVS